MEGLHYKTQVKGESTYYLYDSGNLLCADVKFGSAVRYDPFGILTSETGDASNRLTYTGQQYDRQTGQYYLRARYYNPVIGRFTQQDTYRGDGLNLYAYCANNPVRYVDPSGHILGLYGNDPQDPAYKNGTEPNWEAHNVANYAKLKEQYRVSELANDAVDSIAQTGALPNNYITKSQARAMGWSEGKALDNYAPGKALGGDIFANTTGILPTVSGRIWYEADIGIDYTMSRSNLKNPAYRILYSNDGLIYGTYDHYYSVFQIFP